jgi:hypothetical protein
MTFVACFYHKTTLTGVIDVTGPKRCTVEMDSGDLIVIDSTLCKTYKEGDKIIFYGRKE